MLLHLSIIATVLVLLCPYLYEYRQRDYKICIIDVIAWQNTIYK